MARERWAAGNSFSDEVRRFAAPAAVAVPPRQGEGRSRYLEIRRLSMEPAMESNAALSWDTSCTS